MNNPEIKPYFHKKKCSRCKGACTYKFDIESNPRITVIYMYLCRKCYKQHTPVTRDRYILIGPEDAEA